MGKSVIYASDKGGVGKTTTVTNTASALVNKSKSVAILKTDKNPDVLNWNRRRRKMVCLRSLSTKPMATSVRKLSDSQHCMKRY